MHVHCSAKGDKREQVENLDYIVSYFQLEFEKLAQRNLQNYCSTRVNDYIREIKSKFRAIPRFEVTKRNISEGKASHRTAVQEGSHTPTIEIRIFSQCWDMETLLGRLELCNNLINNTKEPVIGKTLREIITSENDMYLPQYLKKCGITTNELNRKLRERIEVSCA
jgi:hypothetical protein